MTTETGSGLLASVQLRVLRAVTRGDNLRLILRDLCRLIEAAVEQAVCSVTFFDPHTGLLRYESVPSLPVLEGAEWKPGPFSGSCGAAAYHCTPIYVADTLTDPRWESLRTLACNHDLRACWSMPILNSQEELLGTFAITRRIKGLPDERHVEVLTLAMSLASMAIARTREVRELRESRARFRDLVESVCEWVWETDARGVVTYSSPQVKSLLGLDADEVVGRRLGELISGPPGPCFPAALWERSQAAPASGSAEALLTATHRDGRDVMLESSVSPVRDSAGTTHGWRGVARDVTERVRAERAREAHERQAMRARKLESLGILAGGVAHDFNNLLVGILGNTDLLDAEVSGGEGREALADVRLAATQAADLCRQLLAYAGQGQRDTTTFDLNQLVIDAERVLRSSVDAHGKLTLGLESGLPAFTGDEAQIRQTVLNLLVNAFDALGGERGTVEVRTSFQRLGAADLRKFQAAEGAKPGDYVILTVRDSGCGMDDATAKRIFDPFFTTKPTGRGLGLAATVGILRHHRGAVRAESQVGHGTTFTVALPAERGAAARDASTTDGAGKNGEAKGKPKTEPAKTEPAERGRGLALVADDEPLVRQLLTRMLVRNGFTVCAATNGSEAVALFAEHIDHVRVVILDGVMPVMSGDEALREIRALDRNVPVVFSSGYSRDRLDVGDDEHIRFLRKPYQLSEFVRVIDEVTGG